MPYAGELAALLTAVCWSINSVCFTLAGRRVGSPAVNASRLFMALAMLLVVHQLLYGTPFPFHAGGARLAALGVSGLIGFALGDALLFEAFLLLGARVAMLLMTLSPVFSALLAWAFLGQTLSPLKLAAIAATLGGIAWVVAEGSDGATGTHGGARSLGVLLGIGGALGQSVGLILSEYGMRGGLPSLSANLVRVVAGTAAISLWFLVRGQFLDQARRLRDVRASVLIFVGAVTGPFIGVVLSLYAITHASMGVAATLMSLSPVILLPLSVFVFRERVSPRAWAGTVVSLAGAAALFWV
ncbi:DMT family transporter [Mesoterricola sediminis]|uniref:EamA domain-containing protein n=1 Tax=Mesoterricola sediminis TaxID=2927980 RepID=A0AA48GQ98_9BACT|nr:DMT family transporter [Mesoterricola sediminis]BDU75594.1 hypothetical protein METESE_05520 [Mesoterricola sediminis]